MRSECLDQTVVVDLFDFSIDDRPADAPRVDVLGGVFGLVCRCHLGY